MSIEAARLGLGDHLARQQPHPRRHPAAEHVGQVVALQLVVADHRTMPAAIRDAEQLELGDLEQSRGLEHVGDVRGHLLLVEKQPAFAHRLGPAASKVARVT
jgi:hypothetical protein